MVRIISIAAAAFLITSNFPASASIVDVFSATPNSIFGDSTSTLDLQLTFTKDAAAFDGRIDSAAVNFNSGNGQSFANTYAVGGSFLDASHSFLYGNANNPTSNFFNTIYNPSYSYTATITERFLRISGGNVFFDLLTFSVDSSGQTTLFVITPPNTLVPDTPSVSATPLPPAWTMMLIGIAGFGFMAFRRNSNQPLMAA